MRLSLGIGVLLVVIGVHGGSVDGPTAQEARSRFRSGVDLVSLNVTVTDASLRHVTDLGKRDFQIFEDGRRQELTFFQKTGLPLALVLLLDTSSSMQENLTVAQEAAVGFARELGPADLASVIAFASTVHVLQDFTNDRSAIERAIRHTHADGSTALYNAVYIALRELNKAPPDPRSAEPRRQAIVLLSDGDDTSSLVGLDDVLDLAARNATTIYAIGLGVRSGPGTHHTDAQFALRRFAERTGGRTFFPRMATDLAAVYGEIKAELSSQYSLAYASNNIRRDGQFRRVAVHVERTGVVARTRPGYYAAAR